MQVRNTKHQGTNKRMYFFDLQVIFSRRISFKYPNMLAGVVGNEAMNSLMTWKAAPCIKAYVRDLKIHMEKNMHRKLPLLYTAQGGGIGAPVTAPEAMRLTANYLSCQSNKQDSSIHVFGINVESWCSSLGGFERNDDGAVGAYFELWQALWNASVSLVFAEMGCAHSLFNRDNDVADKSRDWKQILIVLNDMADSWSGFCACAYDGNVGFDMFDGGPWNGRDVLEPTQDFFNFQHQLAVNRGVPLNLTLINREMEPPFCGDVMKEMQSFCDFVFQEHHVELLDVDKIPSYQHSSFCALSIDQTSDDDSFSINHTRFSGNNLEGVALVATAVLLNVAALLIARSRWRMQHSYEGSTEAAAMNVQCQPIN